MGLTSEATESKLGYTIPSTDESSFSPLFPRYFSINLPVFCGVHPVYEAEDSWPDEMQVLVELDVAA